MNPFRVDKTYRKKKNTYCTSHLLDRYIVLG